jgi:KDO2-lipid IV(A) lauroyltransferase
MPAKRRLHLRRRILQPLVTALAFLSFTIIQIMPRGFTVFLSRVIGWLIFAVPSCKRLIMANLAVAFPDWTDARRRSVGRQSIQNITLTFMESIWLLRRLEMVPSLFNPSDEEVAGMRAIVPEGEGAIFVTPHLGNWELAHMGLNAIGFPISGVAAEITNPYLEKTMTRCRRSCGGDVIHAKGASKEILKTLKSARCVGLLIDQNTKPRRGGIFVDYFGLPVPVSRAPGMFARRAGAPVVVGACIRRPDATFAFPYSGLSKPIDDYESEHEVVQEIIAIQERMIREFPEHYLWMYQRFRYIPKDLPEDQAARYPYYAKRSS